MKLAFVDPVDPPVSRLFIDSSRRRPNQRGDVPEIDFAAAGPFRLLCDRDVSRIHSLVEANRHRAYVNGRSTSLRGVLPLIDPFDDPRLAMILTRIAGVELALHPISIERAHVNLQTRPDKPVDDWHIDYVPFVCVTMITCPPRDGGALRTKGFGDFSLRPGEAVLLQGSHVEHRADAVREGERTTVVTSLVPASLAYRDCTRVLRGALPYSPDEPLAALAAAYRRDRVRLRSERVATAHARDLPEEMRALTYEFERWQDAAARHGENPEHVEAAQATPTPRGELRSRRPRRSRRHRVRPR